MRWPWWGRRKAPSLHVAVDEGTGPIVVLIHGIASSHVTFQELVPRLSGAHRVISLDILGFGSSPASIDGDYSLDEHAAALDATLRGLRIRGRFVLVGHSLGSLIAARYAADHPTAVSRLVLVSPPVYLAPTAFGTPRDRTAMGLYMKAYEYLRENPAFTIAVARGLDRISPIRNLLDVSETNWNAFVLSLKNAIESQSTVSDVARVRVPVEVVYGTLDPFLMPSGIQILERMRHVTVHRVEAGDHVIRKRFAKAVVKAIDGAAT